MPWHRPSAPCRRHGMRPHQKMILIEQYGAGTFMLPAGKLRPAPRCIPLRPALRSCGCRLPPPR